MEPFTEPPMPRASIHTSSFILEKKPGVPLQRKDWGNREAFGVAKFKYIAHQTFRERVAKSLSRISAISRSAFRSCK